MSNNATKLLADAAAYKDGKLTGYHVVNTETGNVIKLPASGIKIVGDNIVGLKSGLRIATRADFDPHGHAAEVEAAAQAAADPVAKAAADAAEYIRQGGTLPDAAKPKKGA